MAKKPKENPKPKKDDGGDAEKKSGGSRKMILMAVGLCIASLGGGFFLARMAYVEDSEAFEVEYKDGEEQTEKMADDGHGDDHGGKDKAKDDYADDGHGGGDDHAKADKDDGHGKKDDKAKGKNDGEKGLMEFGDLITNVDGFDSFGRPVKSFLKVNIVMAYRTEPGASELIEQREPFMRDLFNAYLRGLTASDVQGMAGILYIKAELLKRARAAVGNDLPQEILIKELILQ
ncbi:flagellar basal body-associated protein FliL [uncultured Sulfitobacter sp.]|uniref:flagellar basal body-associated FliL family protein n=1 Tax=uncultured Sulfitobacter sp. TaxID=191468 RepID=UPI002616ECF2|nr:flagellar basal body-associated FliL family protein [uncultured Sulfitobacter sp.]